MKTVQFSEESYNLILNMLEAKFYTAAGMQESKQVTEAIVQMGAELDNSFFKLLKKRVQVTEDGR